MTNKAIIDFIAKAKIHNEHIEHELSKYITTVPFNGLEQFLYLYTRYC